MCKGGSGELGPKPERFIKALNRRLWNFRAGFLLEPLSASGEGDREPLKFAFTLRVECIVVLLSSRG